MIAVMMIRFIGGVFRWLFRGRRTHAAEGRFHGMANVTPAEHSKPKRAGRVKFRFQNIWNNAQPPPESNRRPR